MASATGLSHAKSCGLEICERCGNEKTAKGSRREARKTNSLFYRLLVEQRGIEPLTSALRTRRSAKLSYCPTEDDPQITQITQISQKQKGELCESIRG